MSKDWVWISNNLAIPWTAIEICFFSSSHSIFATPIVHILGVLIEKIKAHSRKGERSSARIMKYCFKCAVMSGSVTVIQLGHMVPCSLWLIEPQRRLILWSELEEIICARDNVKSDDKHSLVFPGLHLNSPQCQLWNLRHSPINYHVTLICFHYRIKEDLVMQRPFSAVRRPREQMWLQSHFGVIKTTRNLQFKKGLDSRSYVTT